MDLPLKFFEKETCLGEEKYTNTKIQGLCKFLEFFWQWLKLQMCGLVAFKIMMVEGECL